MRLIPVALATAVVTAVVLAGCSTPSTESQPDPTGAPVTDVCGAPAGDAARAVSVSGAVGDAPTVEFEPGLTVTETERVVLAQGTEVAPGAPVGVAYALYNGTTGDELETYGYAEGEPPTSFRADLGVVAAGFAKTLGCLGPGSRAVGVIPADEGFGDAGTQFGLGADDSLVFVIDVLEDQSPVEWTTDLPEIGGTDEAPTLTIADAPAKTDLELTVLREGDGAVVGAADQVTVNYLGVAWETGEVFDSSFDRGTPATFSVQGVVAGFSAALIGQKVGSRVLVTMPPSLGYGGSPGHELEKSTLVFLIDIVDTTAG